MARSFSACRLRRSTSREIALNIMKPSNKNVKPEMITIAIVFAELFASFKGYILHRYRIATRGVIADGVLNQHRGRAKLILGNGGIFALYSAVSLYHRVSLLIEFHFPVAVYVNRNRYAINLGAAVFLCILFIDLFILDIGFLGHPAVEV